MIKLIEISKKFKKNQVLKNVSVEFQKGDLVYIHGINGSGKSTLFKMISDILQPDEGKVGISNDVVIGAMIENPSFMENQTLKFNLKFLADLNGCYNKTYIESLCDKFHLDFNSKEKMKSYSVGMRQKAGIIQAIMENQNFILFDEPTRGLDKEGIMTFVEIINQLHKEEKIIVIASHEYLKEIEFNKSFILSEGILIEEN